MRFIMKFVFILTLPFLINAAWITESDITKCQQSLAYTSWGAQKDCEEKGEKCYQAGSDCFVQVLQNGKLVNDPVKVAARDAAKQAEDAKAERLKGLANKPFPTPSEKDELLLEIAKERFK